MITHTDSIEVLRAKWLELEYDSIMSNSPGKYLWAVLKSDAAQMTHGEFIDALDEMEAFDDTQT